MRTPVLLSFLLGFQLLVGPSCAQPNTVASSAKVSKKYGATKVTIVYVLDYLKPAETDKQHSALSETELHQAIAAVFSENRKLALTPCYPDYILEMVALINDKKKQEQALAIYYAKNPDEPTRLSSTRSASRNGKAFTVNNTTLSLTVSVEVKEKTSVTIPAYTIASEGRVFHTKELVVEL